ncbi:MAG: EcsC family protein [Alphaproteobacteria bacterium]|nr:EcsC family protein [Alphaproteobacteria bacterium]
MNHQGSNACAGLDEASHQILEGAASDLINSKSIVIQLTELAGNAMGAAGSSASDIIKDKFGIDVTSKAQDIAESALKQVLETSTTGMDLENTQEKWGWFHKLLATASGAGAGFIGAPGLLFDLPVTTGIIMRSIAEIARSNPGENLDSEDTKRACIEVFAFGGPENNDDEADAGYWAVRTGLNHIAIEMLIKTVAARFSIVITEKILAQIVPIAGMFAGGALNYAFIGYYQQMARVHFAIRKVERGCPDPSMVRACFSEKVRLARSAGRRELAK